MQITVTELDAATRRVTLVGRLDILAAEAIGLPLAAAAGARGNMIVDMAGVDFIASLGIRQLVTTAKTVARGAGRLVLLRPNPVVAEVLSASGLDQLLPIVQSEDEARAAFAGATGA
jgi:anti-sigma B factor antagonist